MALDTILNVLGAIGEETRMRVIVLLSEGELTVTELTQILGQSQPRVSRHLKILAKAGIVESHREGSWMFYRAVFDGPASAIAMRELIATLVTSKDGTIARDLERLRQIREARAAAAAAYFQKNAADWDTVRSYHVPEEAIEAKMVAMAGADKIETFVDLGTGTGRILTLFADAYREGVGIDLSREMLAVARSNLDAAGIRHAQVRHGDLFSLPLEMATADVVCMHQVLHFLAEPAAAVQEAARILKPGGKLLLSDFAPHEKIHLRDFHAHRRLGFADEEVAGWCKSAGLDLVDIATLSPDSNKPDGLTVKIWLCKAAASVRFLKKRGRAA